MLTCLAAAPDQWATIDSIIGQMWVQVNDYSSDPLVKAKDQTAFSINVSFCIVLSVGLRVNVQLV
jgi:hypothetical protein